MNYFRSISSLVLDMQKAISEVYTMFSIAESKINRMISIMERRDMPADKITSLLPSDFRILESSMNTLEKEVPKLRQHLVA